MPTMATYELKVTALIKDGTPDGEAGQAAEHFERIFQRPDSAPCGCWQTDFFPNYDTVLKEDTVVKEGDWDLLPGSKIKAQSHLLAGSILNERRLDFPETLGADTEVLSKTILKNGSILKAGTEIENDQYSTMLWRAGQEGVPKWGLHGHCDVKIVGRYGLLSFQGVIGIVRSGALGYQWARQSGLDDLEWFYKYREQSWFKKLIADLIKFNDQWAKILEEGARVRELKWYCGNGSGP